MVGKDVVVIGIEGGRLVYMRGLLVVDIIYNNSLFPVL
jgi:hypothetical protein